MVCDLFSFACATNPRIKQPTHSKRTRATGGLTGELQASKAEAAELRDSLAAREAALGDAQTSLEAYAQGLLPLFFVYISM